MRKVFLEDLHVWESGSWKGRIDWIGSVGSKIRFIYKDIEGYVEIISYNKRRLTILYNEKTHELSTRGFANCELGKLLNKKTSDFKIEIGKVFKDEKRDITIIDRKYIKDNRGCKWKVYKYTCNKCGFNGNMRYYDSKNKKYANEYYTKENGLLNGTGCICCDNKIVVKGINDVNTTRPDLVKYFVNIEDSYICTRSSKEKFKLRCEGVNPHIYEANMNTLSDGHKCPYCSQERKESYLQEKVRLYLNDILNYKTLHEFDCNIIPHNPKTNHQMPFDNEVVDLRLIIEVHGESHYKKDLLIQKNAKRNRITPEEELHKRKLYDRYKRIFAKQQGYFYLEIPYWTDDKNETWKKLIDDKIEEIKNINGKY